MFDCVVQMRERPHFCALNSLSFWVICSIPCVLIVLSGVYYRLDFLMLMINDLGGLKVLATTQILLNNTTTEHMEISPGARRVGKLERRRIVAMARQVEVDLADRSYFSSLLDVLPVR